MRFDRYQLAAIVMQCVALLIAGLDEARGQGGVYRCTGVDGAISLQDRPCAAAQQAERVEIGTVNILEPDSDALRIIARDRLDAATTTEAELFQSLGSPTVTNTDYSADGTVRRQHVYRYRDGSRRYVYTQDGVVTSVQVRPAVDGRSRPGRR